MSAGSVASGLFHFARAALLPRRAAMISGILDVATSPPRQAAGNRCAFWSP